MRSMVSYSKTAMERAMKVEEVILRAMAKRITWWQAAEIIGISDRHMRRWRERYEEFGYDGLFDRRRGTPSPKRVPLAQAEQVLGLYREKYFDLNVRHFHEKLREEHRVELSYTWVKRALQGAGLVERGRKRGVHRKRRPRRVLPGAPASGRDSQHDSRAAPAGTLQRARCGHQASKNGGATGCGKDPQPRRLLPSTQTGQVTC
jgi:transposase